MNDQTWQWQKLHATDAQAIHDLILRIEEADSASIRTSGLEVESYFHDSHVWRAQGAWVGDYLVAFGLARTPKGNAGAAPITVSGGVAPQWRDRGVGKDLLQRQLLTSREVADELGLLSADVHMYVESSQADLIGLANEFNFTTVSQFVQMRRSLDLPMAGVDTSQYIQIIKFSDDWMKDTRKAHNKILAGSQSWSKLDAQAWKDRISGMEEDWCFVALDLFGDRPKLAGYLLASRFSSQISGLDAAVYEEGYVEEIVVLPQWRGKNVASSLMVAAMDRFRADGLNYIGLDVVIDEDGENAELVAVFEHFDFERVAETYIVATRV
ncbi:GNAT family N-acetyltransferase [Trueperella bonasi]|nr:GNAT family N-acetyltransferase [Trueperella bonasi]